MLLSSNSFKSPEKPTLATASDPRLPGCEKAQMKKLMPDLFLLSCQILTPAFTSISNEKSIIERERKVQKPSLGENSKRQLEIMELKPVASMADTILPLRFANRKGSSFES